MGQNVRNHPYIANERTADI